jgi:hypothetical protein
MARPTAEGPVVEMPSLAADTPSWTRVGIIAVIGFVAGVAWPRLAGVRLGPSLPDGASSPLAANSAESQEAVPDLAKAAAAAIDGGIAPAVALPTVADPPVSSPPMGASTALKDAQVEWEVALIRDAPKSGKVIARLPRGSQVRVGPAKDGWYPVKYGGGYSGDGWVYRGAIGR